LNSGQTRGVLQSRRQDAALQLCHGYTKLLAAGVKIRGVEEALEDSLKNWKPE